MKVISIVGPTATGKTDLALKLAQNLITDNKYLGVDVISADSRQVYKGLEVISGADVPTTLPTQVALHGIGIVNPDQEWSVGHFQNFALPIIEHAFAQSRLPIVVGGTGLYHDRLFETDPQLHIAPNVDLRAQAEQLTVPELQNWLQRVDQEKFEALNYSDRHNPRRLIRAIEVAMESNSSVEGLAARGRRSVAEPSAPSRHTHLYLGLRDDLEAIRQRVTSRVADRWHHGALEEVKRLLAQYTDWSLPAFSTTGVAEIKLFIEGRISETECVERWSLRELQYAKRQLTWWKAKPVHWYDITDKNRYTKIYAEFF